MKTLRGNIIPPILQMSKLRCKRLGNLLKVTQVVSGTLPSEFIPCKHSLCWSCRISTHCEKADGISEVVLNW